MTRPKVTNPIVSILTWFMLAKPNPTVEDQSVQLGCHFEEVAESFEALVGPEDECAIRLHEQGDAFKAKTHLYLHTLSDLTDGQKADLLDAQVDQIVTSIGVCYMMGFDLIGAIRAVDDANWAKFVDGKPQFTPQGKIAKPEGWTAPNLAPFIRLAK